MKRILLSLVTIGVVGVAGVGAARAFFSDKEVSKGNVLSAGTLDLQIDSDAHYDGMICKDGFWVDEDTDQNNNPRPELLGTKCDGSWPAKSLVSEKFFNLNDVKPGDEGENTISLHVTNDSFACVRIDNMVTGKQSADLAKGLFFTAWGDKNCDNIFNGDETLLFTNKQGPASDVLNGKTYPLGKLASNEKSCIGLRWCAGTMTIDESTHSIQCNGASLGNEAQGDSVQADIAFYAEQSRNNPNFSCDRVDWTKILPSPSPNPAPPGNG